ncbi:TVP38/TMEM64 family protein [Petrocella sp. FN5]|uniref:TVP38/TMEM64 family protein n=1 Tax=Petrocella sp. FN5 TaxID=3032002 RepID=UPI0023DAF631|nr:TVP38/TMEM64 family protein [Petrocella sp. FN5]MDF1618747.1 TVP38/TMEM64 family protein [Petrocella sp. FN5]
MFDAIRKYKKYIGIGIIITVGIIAYWNMNELLNIAKMLSEGSVEDVVALIRSFGLGAPIISVLLMILQAFIAPIPSFLITGANGIVFGIVGGTLISWVGAMLGAAGTFYLARVLGEDFVKRFEQSKGLMKKVNEISRNHGMKVVFIGRLIPFVSFDFLSYAAGLSTIKAWQFIVATGVGMIPGTIAYVLLGNQIIEYSQYSKQVFWLILMGVIVYVIYLKIKKFIIRN